MSLRREGESRQIYCFCHQEQEKMQLLLVAILLTMILWVVCSRVDIIDWVLPVRTHNGSRERNVSCRVSSSPNLLHRHQLLAIVQFATEDHCDMIFFGRHARHCLSQHTITFPFSFTTDSKPIEILKSLPGDIISSSRQVTPHLLLFTVHLACSSWQLFVGSKIINDIKCCFCCYHYC